MLTEKSFISSVNVLLPLAQIEIKRTNVILQDGVEVAKTYHRHVLAPGDSLVNQDPAVVATAGQYWTPEVVEAYQRKLQDDKN